MPYLLIAPYGHAIQPGTSKSKCVQAIQKLTEKESFEGNVTEVSLDCTFDHESLQHQCFNPKGSIRKIDQYDSFQAFAEQMATSRSTRIGSVTISPKFVLAAKYTYNQKGDLMEAVHRGFSMVITEHEGGEIKKGYMLIHGMRPGLLPLKSDFEVTVTHKPFTMKFEFKHEFLSSTPYVQKQRWPARMITVLNSDTDTESTTTYYMDGGVKETVRKVVSRVAVCEK